MLVLPDGAVLVDDADVEVEPHLGLEVLQGPLGVLAGDAHLLGALVHLLDDVVLTVVLYSLVFQLAKTKQIQIFLFQTHRLF